MDQHQQLIKDCINGNKWAQYRLYELFAPAMLAVCHRYTKSLEDAEDVLQDGFIKVFHNLKQVKEAKQLQGWIKRIMINTAITYLKTHNRYKNDLSIGEINVHPISDEQPDITIQTKDLADIIRDLPTAYQLIFNLIAIEGFNYQEVCDLLQMNINTVRSQYSRARAMLIQKLTQTNYIKSASHVK